MAARQMKLGLFVRPCGHHIASWRHPLCQADAGVNFPHFVEMARTAERGLFDMLFSADSATVWTAAESAIDRVHYVAWMEPFTLMSALSGFTEKIGLACTASTSFEQPYSLARKFATLDIISGGRCGWNVVTSGNETEALNFSKQPHLPKVERYKRAREFVDVVRALWDSWDEDAFLRDKESGIFFDRSKMHVLDHHGQFYDVRGPLNVARSPQGQPVIVQAGASDDGRQLAAETAEVNFCAHDFDRKGEGVLSRRQRTHDEMRPAAGRSEDSAGTFRHRRADPGRSGSQVPESPGIVAPGARRGAVVAAARLRSYRLSARPAAATVAGKRRGEQPLRHDLRLVEGWCTDSA